MSSPMIGFKRSLESGGHWAEVRRDHERDSASIVWDHAEQSGKKCLLQCEGENRNDIIIKLNRTALLKEQRKRWCNAQEECCDDDELG